MDNNSDSLFWLVEDRFRLKASIRYQIKQYELQLAQQIAEIEFSEEVLPDILHVCKLLIQSYERWQSLMQTSHLAKIDNIRINEFKPCFLYLQELQMILAQHSNEVNEACVINKLLFYYQNLHSLLLGEENTYSETHELDEGMQSLLASEESDKRLELMPLSHPTQLFLLSEEELLKLFYGVIDELERRFFAVSNFPTYQQSDSLEPREQIVRVERDKNTRLEELFKQLEKREEDTL